MYICIYVYMYICIYVYMYICIYVYMYICIYVYMYICIYVYMYICIYVYMYICIYVYMYICICNAASINKKYHKTTTSTTWVLRHRVRLQPCALGRRQEAAGSWSESQWKRQPMAPGGTRRHPAPVSAKSRRKRARKWWTLIEGPNHHHQPWSSAQSSRTKSGKRQRHGSALHEIHFPVRTGAFPDLTAFWGTFIFTFIAFKPCSIQGRAACWKYELLAGLSLVLPWSVPHPRRRCCGREALYTSGHDQLSSCFFDFLAWKMIQSLALYSFVVLCLHVPPWVKQTSDPKKLCGRCKDMIYMICFYKWDCMKSKIWDIFAFILDLSIWKESKVRAQDGKGPSL